MLPPVTIGSCRGSRSHILGWGVSQVHLDADLIRLIKEETAKATVKLGMRELQRNRMLKPKDDTFIRVEKLLYGYPDFQRVIQDKLASIEEINNHGLPRRSKSLVVIPKGCIRVDDPEEERIEAIQRSIIQMQEHISLIDAALDHIRGDKYFDLIRMKYFEGCSHEEIAYEFEVDVSTITRNKNRLINTLKIYLFPDDSIIELFDW